MVVVGRGVWQIGEIWPTSRLRVSIDFIYDSDAQIVIISNKCTPLTRLSHVGLYAWYVCNIKQTGYVG